MRNFIQDLTYAARQLRQAPGFTAVAVLTLALGIGANTAIFTLVHAILLQPLPVKNPNELYRLGSKDVNCCVQGGLQDDWDNYSYPLYLHIKEQTPEFAELAAMQAGRSVPSVRRAGENGPARPLVTEFVSGNYFPMFGLQAAAGRLIAHSDDQAGAPPVAVMSHRAWQNYYASDPSVVGSSFIVNGAPVTVVGIAPDGFYGDRLSDAPPELWVPLSFEPIEAGAISMLKLPNVHWLYVMGRPKSGMEPSKVSAKMTLQLQHWLESAEGTGTVGDSDRKQIQRQRVGLISGAGGANLMANYAEKGLRLLMTISALVLLIACANIANLLLARGTARKAQTSVRLALGAGRARLIRQMLTESVLLSVLGGAVGVLLAYMGTRSILAIAFRGSEFVPINPHPSQPVLFFSLGLSLLTGIVFGVGPAFIATKADPAEALRGAGRATAHGASLPQKSLVVLQAAVSLVLVAGAIMLAQSLRRLEHQNFGFQTDHRYIVQVGHAFADFPKEKLPGAYAELRQKLNAIPGVISSSYSLYSPMEGNNWSGPVYLPGRQRDTGEHGDYASWLRIGPDYFQTVGTRLLRGRTIGEQDTPTSPLVAVVNQQFAKKFFPGEDPIGKRFGTREKEHAADFEIVGVVEDTKYQDAHGPAYPTFFLPYLQFIGAGSNGDTSGQMRSQRISTIELNVAGAPENLESTVRRVLSESDPDMTLIRMTSFAEQVSEQLNQERLVARLTVLFGGLALTLAAIGLYGVTAYSVERRTREIGVRVAVGANRANVIAMVLRGAARQVVLGLIIGLVLSLVAGRLISSQLFEVKGHDPLALLGAALLLALFALIAGFVPASRAARIDPVRALRIE